jgi:hypothetical protein
MASNSLPKTVVQVIGLGGKMHQGLITYGADLKISQITPEEFEAELQTLISKEGVFNAARTARQSASNAFKSADGTLSGWLAVTRNVLAARFGGRWSTMWAQAGFNNSTTAIPRRIEDRLGLALSLANFFTDNPSYEVKSMEVTADQANQLRDTALAAQQVVMAADVTLKTTGDERDVAFEIMIGTMRSLVRFLDGTLSAYDPRWLAFGLEMPSTNTTPGKPGNVTAMLDPETGAIIVQCDQEPLATRYRWRGLIVGAETEYRLLARSTEPIGVITGIIMPGQKLEIIVQAVNGDSQGVASDPIVFTMPLAAQAKAKTTAPATESAGLAVNEEALAAAGDGVKSRARGNRLPALT